MLQLGDRSNAAPPQSQGPLRTKLPKFTQEVGDRNELELQQQTRVAMNLSDVRRWHARCFAFLREPAPLEQWEEQDHQKISAL
jgi:hypothetical protein